MHRDGFRTKRGMRMPIDGTKRLAVHIKNGLLILLTIALAVTLIFGLPAIRYKAGARDYMVNRMVVECGDAQYYLSKLSNTGGSSTYAQLAKIRSEIYAIQILSQAYAGMEGSGGSALVDDAVFTNIFSLIDSYYNQLITSATNTSSILSNLDEALTNLQTTLSALQ